MQREKNKNAGKKIDLKMKRDGKNWRKECSMRERKMSQIIATI